MAILRWLAAKPQDDGNGALFKNDRKERPSHLDYHDEATIRGKRFWVSAWIKTTVRHADEEAKSKPKPAARRWRTMTYASKPTFGAAGILH
jgi:hypothetical protein